ncbi:hypothetical protein M413DRAFT_439084 [Hebeloma cylindrosporum]|uniref:Uncharacterized protein n=1 Tax=Hebeloma cylindrosporum TaxID=76867 RepID=A0A0C2Z2E3_HEBCY|nr:hypothetical protein M413DRAFT_439084 [Hebeloma cylindrosporum h7]
MLARQLEQGQIKRLEPHHQRRSTEKHRVILQLRVYWVFSWRFVELSPRDDPRTSGICRTLPSAR